GRRAGRGAGRCIDRKSAFSQIISVFSFGGKKTAFPESWHKEVPMPEIPSSNRLRIARLVLIPSIITLVVTLLRAMGELQHWSPALFNSSPGGGGALVGITWLVPIFGIYFALKLSAAGEGLVRVGKASGLAVLGVALMAGGSLVVVAPQINLPGKVVIGVLLIVAAAVLQFKSWPALSKVLLAY